MVAYLFLGGTHAGFFDKKEAKSMENGISPLAAIKRIIEYLVAESKDFDDAQNLVTELAAKNIFALFARDLGVKQHNLERELLHPCIWSATGETRLRVIMFETMSWAGTDV